MLSKEDNFLQSSLWQEFQESFGRKTFRIEENNQEILLIKHQALLGLNYFYAPRAFLNENLLKEVEALAQKEGCIFLRIDPINEISDIDFRKIKIDSSQPQDCWILKLDKSAEDILSGMKQKTRYNLKLAQNKVEVTQSLEEKDINIFYKIAQDTASRQKIRLHPKKYYQKMFEIFKKQNAVTLYLAKFEGEVLAANLVIFAGMSATYLHGASSDKHRNLMAPYFLQMEAILEAQKRGCMFYDFGGVAPEGEEAHQWAGISRFKRGFGGEALHFPDSYDIIFKPAAYKIYQGLRWLNSTFR